MKRFVVPLLLALSLLMAGLPASTRAADVIQFQIGGFGTFADFTTVAECLVSRVRLQTGDQRIKEAGKPDTPTKVLIVISQYDPCAEQSVALALGAVEVAPSTLQIDQQLNTATLQLTGVALFEDVSATTVPVDINVTWMATDGVRRQKGSLTERLGDLTISERYDESYRLAVAAGTVTMAGSANLTPEPTHRAKIESIRSNTTVISR